MKNIKNKKFIVVLFSGFFMINSCSDKDLELTNPTQLSSETFFKTEAQVQSSVNAAYANLQTIALYSRYHFFCMDNMGQDNSGNTQLEGDKKLFLNFSFNSSDPNIKNYWDACYLGITKCNFVLANEAKIKALDAAVLTDVKKAKYLAEARFMRGYYYFLLVNRFGGVPLTIDLSATFKGRSTKQEVFDLIVTDFKFGISNLLSKSAEQKGRATKEAAQAYLAKALVYQKKYDEALTVLNAISGFSLEPVFTDNFEEDKEHGVESIFEIEYNESLGTGSMWNSGTSGEGPNDSTFRGQEYGCLDWFNVYPSYQLLDTYEANDKRYKGTFYSQGDTYYNGQVMNSPNLTLRRAGWRKYSNYYQRDNENLYSGINFKVMRYAEVILMKAECENMRAGGSQSLAVGYINEIRFRAGLPLLATTLTKDQVFKALVKECKVEFAGEQHRFDDVVRWGIAATELAGSGFTANKNELWPIPDNEMAVNKMITAADQNPGW